MPRNTQKRNKKKLKKEKEKSQLVTFLRIEAHMAKTRGHFLVRRAKIRYSDNQNTSEKIQHIS